MNIGQQIQVILSQRKVSKQTLSGMIGVTGSAVNYLMKRESIDVETLHKISVGLKYNFFKHYPVEELKEAQAELPLSAEAIENKKLQEKISELEKQLESCKRDLMIQKQENGYLKKINELLERK